MDEISLFEYISQNGEIALHIAARHGQLKMVQALISDGGDPLWQNKVGTNVVPYFNMYSFCLNNVIFRVTLFLIYCLYLAFT